MTDIGFYLKLMKERHASDLFLTTGAPPSIKVDGLVQPLEGPKLAVGEVLAMAQKVMTDAQNTEFEQRKEANFSWSRKDMGRYRVNVFHQRGEVGMVLRMINSHVPDFHALGLPQKVQELAMQKRGLVLVVGAAGAGKSTTLAAMIRYRSENAPGHIVTIEDPIEFLFAHSKSLVDQREVGIDTLSFGEALRNALRESPDVIMLGEIRDQETAQHALAYAETGHLCISTMHANNAAQAIDHYLSFYPEDAHKRVLSDLSLNLKAVVSQRLVPSATGSRVLAVEILLQTAFIADLIERGKLTAIHDEMAKGNAEGMVTFDQSLFALMRSGRITEAQALDYADSPTNMAVKIRLGEHHSPREAPEFGIAPGPKP